MEQGGTTNPTLPPPNPSSSSAADEKLSPEQLDLILRFNDAIQQHLTPPPHDARIAGSGSSVDPHGARRGGGSQLAPSGVRPPAESGRQPMQNVELGEDVPDNNGVDVRFGWVSEEDY